MGNKVELKNKLFEIEFGGKKYRYVFKNLTSIQAETANQIMAWYNDAINRFKEANLKEVQRSDLSEVKDAIVAHLVCEVGKDKKPLPYSPDEARTSVKEFMMGIPADGYSETKDGIIDNFFLMQGKSHLAMMLLRKEQKKSLTKENIDLIVALATAQKNSTESQTKKNSESIPSTMAN